MCEPNSPNLFADDKQAARLQAEADFGFREVAPHVNRVPTGASIMEVGCGTGLLLTRMAEKFGDYSFTGVEPIGPGFSQFAETLSAFERKYENIRFIRERIEDVREDQQFDLIYSVNVFEHLNDWRKAIDKCCTMLKPGGRLVVLCPNYCVPYESHFTLPIIINKPLTYRLFEKLIIRTEEKLDASGLWQSLNFIKAPQIRRHCELKGYRFHFDKAIMKRMLDRLDEDPEFRERQSALAKIAILANRLGAGNLLRVLPARFSAYMKVIIEAAE